ncbi:MAG: polymer-forming cytoskeletal protein [Bacteroidia bacterium]|nr:polymer-forming cytoskeletal protein [Bacteroidia bacterium]MDW8235591.1 polymer-forming cytoskeletal protein [Bacteroidia bacterium]
MSLWSKNGSTSPTHEKALSLLGEGSQTKGEITTPGNLRIEGSFSGKLDVAGRLVIAGSAEVSGTIYARQVLVEGKFEGDILAQELVEIGPTAQIKGTLRTRRMECRSGAKLEIHCWVHDDLPPTIPSKPASAPSKEKDKDSAPARTR